MSTLVIVGDYEDPGVEYAREEMDEVPAVGDEISGDGFRVTVRHRIWRMTGDVELLCHPYGDGD